MDCNGPSQILQGLGHVLGRIPVHHRAEIVVPQQRGLEPSMRQPTRWGDLPTWRTMAQRPATVAGQRRPAATNGGVRDNNNQTDSSDLGHELGRTAVYHRTEIPVAGREGIYRPLRQLKTASTASVNEHAVQAFCFSLCSTVSANSWESVCYRRKTRCAPENIPPPQPTGHRPDTNCNWLGWHMLGYRLNSQAPTPNNQLLHLPTDTPLQHDQVSRWIPQRRGRGHNPRRQAHHSEGCRSGRME